MPSMPPWRGLLSDTYRTFSRRGGRILGGAIAFYSMLSIAPMLIIAVHVAGMLTTANRAREALVADLSRWIGPDGADTIAAMLVRAQRSGRGPLSGALGIALLVYASTRLFGALQFSLHQMWGVQSRSGRGVKAKALGQLRKRSLRFVMVIFVGVVIDALVAVKATLAAASGVIGGKLDVSGFERVVELLVSFGVTTVLFVAIFRLLPEVVMETRDVLLGAFVTSLLFSLGTTAVGVWLGRRGIESSWGAATSIVMLLLWVHYSAQIFFLGAAFTEAWARRSGRPIAPNEYSVALVADEDAVS
jgi:membrane protein